MATTPDQAYRPILEAMATLQSSADRAQKTQAHDFLDKFQKSTDAWTTTHAILQNDAAPPESKLFAATTLKSKIVYDLHQLPTETLIPLRDSILSLLKTYRQGPGSRPIRTQLNVCLAGLAIQMVEWTDVVDTVMAALGNDPENLTCLLEFLRVLPEEVSEASKYNLSDKELENKVWELLENSAKKVLAILVQLGHQLPNASSNPDLINCITSWTRELGASPIVNTTLLGLIFSGLKEDASFDSAVDCICNLVQETREVDESLDCIKVLYPKIIALRPSLAASAEDDIDTFRGFTRIFAETGEAWTVLIARMPTEFRELVETIAEVCARDPEREVIGITFNFWYELKNYLVIEKYMDARMQLADIYQTLVEIIIRHLRYPKPENGNERDLFGGDRELEENFREFRHQIGDVLKDCCEVLGPEECLGKAFQQVQAWVTRYSASGAHTPSVQITDWQDLEAALFAMRAMGRMVPPEEKTIVPQIMSLLIQLPEHEKVRYAATLVLGRYTRWTALHPEYLEAELNYITSGFQGQSQDVERAAAMALKFFCQDCSQLLTSYLPILHPFYEKIAPNLPLQSLHEVTEGVAHVVAALPHNQIYDSLKMFCDPIVARLQQKAHIANDEESKMAIAEQVRVLTHFVQYVNPMIEGDDNPMVRYWSSVFDVLAGILDRFLTFIPICERLARFFRSLILSYRTASAPLLSQLAPLLMRAFETSGEGCFLWASAAIIREFGDETEVGKATVDATYEFLQAQSSTMLKILSQTAPREISDLIEDFFRLLADALMFHSTKMITNSTLLGVLFDAAYRSLDQQKSESLIAVLRFLRDLLAFGTEHPPFSNESGASTPVPVQETVKAMVRLKGEVLAARILGGLMSDFPRDCIPDSSGVLLKMAELEGASFNTWMQNTMALLPEGALAEKEVKKFLEEVNNSITTNNYVSLRYSLQDFTNRYRKKNVSYKEGALFGVVEDETEELQIAPRSKISGIRDD